MHGRVKNKEGISPAEQSVLASKAAKYRLLLSSVLSSRHDSQPSTQSMVKQLLRINPDLPTAWNIHREMLPSDAESGEEGKYRGKIDTAAEMHLSSECIERNPKSYGAWFHRVWINSRSPLDLAGLADEKILCAKLLAIDERNFHCWAYRRYISSHIQLMNDQEGKEDNAHCNEEAELEFAFSTARINDNFSNYSAFHHRTLYINNISRELIPLAEEEFNLTEHAIYTEPDDQSAWWYRQFLYGWIEKRMDVNASLEWYRGLLDKQKGVLTSLLELEPTSRWTMNELVILSDRIWKYRVVDDDDDGKAVLSERRHLLELLIQTDPSHANRYRYLLREQA